MAGCKYVKEFTFGGGVGESAKYVKGYYRGGKVAMAEGGAADMKQDKALVKAAVHKHEKAMHAGKPLTKLAKGGAIPGARKMPEGAKSMPAMPRDMPAAKPVKVAEGMRDPSVTRAVAKAPARKSVPVAPTSPLLAMKHGGMAKKGKC